MVKRSCDLKRHKYKDFLNAHPEFTLVPFGVSTWGVIHDKSLEELLLYANEQAILTDLRRDIKRDVLMQAAASFADLVHYTLIYHKAT